MNDDNGSIVLITDTDKVVDHFLYDDNMHSAFIREEEGVSLERISFTEPTNAPSNWKSASSVSGFATPGYVNSNAYGTVLGEDAIVINPEIFQPEYGQPDFAQIQYHFNQGGFVANVKIFDQQGRKIKELANNEILGADGFFRWDGDQENGSKVRVGSYVVWFEVFDEQGVVQTFKKRIAIAGKF
jgi:mRNA-degrading endonuclease RelE of RelBE toxin-antitoxin system